MADRRRINGPVGGTSPPLFVPSKNDAPKAQRMRRPNELRKMFLQAGIVSAASGSAYLELESAKHLSKAIIPLTSTIKLSCTVHGPKPMTRNAVFSPNLQLNASVKFAPFATRLRRGFIRDNTERDLASHLENALKGVVIPDRYPKSSLDVAVTVLEGEENSVWAQEHGEDNNVSGIGLMNVLAGSITVASAALVDAGIDCLDLLTGGVVGTLKSSDGSKVFMLDPVPGEHDSLEAACVVGYLQSRDEIVEVWSKGNEHAEALEQLINEAVKAARGSHSVLFEAISESTTARLRENTSTAYIGAQSSATTKETESKT